MGCGCRSSHWKCIFHDVAAVAAYSELVPAKNKKRKTKSEGKKETLEEKTNGEKIMKLA